MTSGDAPLRIARAFIGPSVKGNRAQRENIQFPGIERAEHKSYL
jgi:hypothetical protein